MSDSTCKHGRHSAEPIPCLRCERESERERIVAWLRSLQDDTGYTWGLAERIEHGEHEVESATPA